MSEYLDITAFIAGKEGKKKPITIGSAMVRQDGTVQLWLNSIPIGWDGSAVCQPRMQRNERGDWKRPQAEGSTFNQGKPPFLDKNKDEDIPF